jgi:two-component system OmpR family response regulator
MENEAVYSVYLVDDSEVYLSALEYALQDNKENKFKIKTFSTGEECLQQIYVSAPDIVVVDYYLNSTSPTAMNGIKVLDKIKAFNKNINVIMLSSQEKLEVAVNSIKFGAYDYVIKNESAFLRIKFLINRIIYSINLKKDIKRYFTWNVVMGILFLFFIIALVIFGITYK